MTGIVHLQVAEEEKGREGEKHLSLAYKYEGRGKNRDTSQTLPSLISTFGEVSSHLSMCR
jgi:hypothetical protein